MKKRLYLKKWLEDTIIVVSMLSAVVMGGMADNLKCPTSALAIPGIIVVASAIILIKYGRIINKDE